jgi:hypothetical protein
MQSGVRLLWKAVVVEELAVAESREQEYRGRGTNAIGSCYQRAGEDSILTRIMCVF